VGYCSRCGCRLSRPVAYCAACHAAVRADIQARQALPVGGMSSPASYEVRPLYGRGPCGQVVPVRQGFLPQEDMDPSQENAVRAWEEG
jgi:hypothetical protein